MDWAQADCYPVRHLPAGTVLFREGDFGDTMYLVAAGRLQVSKRVIEGADKVLSQVEAGHYVGEMCLLTGTTRSATATVLVDTEVVEIDQQTFMALLQDQPQIGLDLLRQMAENLKKTNEELILLALEVALAQREHTPRVQRNHGMCFVAAGSFASERFAEVQRVVAEQAQGARHPALVADLVRLGRTHEALLYIIETDNPRDLLEVIAPFAGLVQWDISPALEVNETFPMAVSCNQESLPCSP